MIKGKIHDALDATRSARGDSRSLLQADAFSFWMPRARRLEPPVSGYCQLRSRVLTMLQVSEGFIYE